MVLRGVKLFVVIGNCDVSESSRKLTQLLYKNENPDTWVVDEQGKEREIEKVRVATVRVSDRETINGGKHDFQLTTILGRRNIH